MTTEDRAELIDMLEQVRECKRVLEAQRDRQAERAELLQAIELAFEIRRDLDATRAREAHRLTPPAADMTYGRVTHAGAIVRHIE